MLTASLLLIVLSLVFTILSALGKGPLWPAVLCLILLHLVR